MLTKIRCWKLKTALIALGITTATAAPVLISDIGLAQVPEPTTPPTTTPTTPSTTTGATNFPDVSPDYWAQPYIQALAARNIITGFPDGTYRPNQAVERAEFAAMIQNAFNQNQVRQLEPGGFKDVPSSYWAASAIQEAYQTGFMSGYPGNLFLPNQQIPKVQAIVALANGLGLTASGTTENILATYYVDASAIPNYATEPVAAATQANIVVNYPDVKVLNPLTPLSRAEAAALIYQALVRIGQAQPLPSNVAAASYIVAGTAGGTQTNQDIVSLAASSTSFTNFTTLLKAAGLADILQEPGPYTVFAPTDEAFAAIPQETLQQLLQPENRETLIRILRYHVIPGELTANELSEGELKTFDGVPVNIQVDSATNQVTVNNASVVQPNIQATNGIIHAVNQVLIPPNIGQAQQPTPDDEPGVSPGRATRGGSSYIGVGANIGIIGESDLGDTNFAAFTKIGLSRYISVRPSASIGSDPVVLVPVAFDFGQLFVSPLGEGFSISPYIGAGVAIEVSDDVDVGFLLSGGVDVPLGTRFTATGGVNAAFLDDVDLGITLGIGYNF
jgi:uncharacterized surface protein with fasciclin (FAS1) repeats